MKYQHKVIEELHRKTIYIWDSEYPYIPGVGDIVLFPEDWKYGSQFIVVKVHHYFVDKLIVISVKDDKI